MKSDCRALGIPDWAGTQSLTDFSWESFHSLLVGVCIFHLTAFSVSKKHYCSNRTQKNSLYLRAGLPPWICPWILPLFPLFPLFPLCIHFSRALQIWNGADIWVRPKGKDSQHQLWLWFLIFGACRRILSFLAACIPWWLQPEDECDSLLSPVTVAAFPVKFLQHC